MIVVNKFKGEVVGVLGLGRTGISVIKSLLAGNARVIAWDDNLSDHGKRLTREFHEYIIDGRLELRLPKTPDWEKFKAIVVSPGIPLKYPEPHPDIASARKYDVPITSDVELLKYSCPDAFYIGVTGTNGKSTTVSLIDHIFKKAGKDAQTGGNIGLPVLEFKASSRAFILELSSFQLDLLQSDNLALDVAVLLNITPDHIDRHGSIENYVEAKSKIFESQKKNYFSIISVDSDIAKNIYKNLKHLEKQIVIGVSTREFLKKGVSVINEKIYDDYFSYGCHELKLPKDLLGLHNAENIAAAYAVSMIYGLNARDVLEGLSSFQGLEHRMEIVQTYSESLVFINDSKATNLEAAGKALETFDNIYWIAGGVSKGSGIEFLSPHFKKLRHVYLIGEAKEEFSKILDEYETPYSVSVTLDNALEALSKIPNASGDVLFSPACASFDQWKNFEERGNAFKSKVMQIWGSDGIVQPALLNIHR